MRNSCDIPLGLTCDLPAADYHAIDAASASRLKVLLSASPAHLRQQLSEPFEPTPEMIFGTMAHGLLLEPDRPLPAVAVEPDKYPSEDGEKPWNNNARHCKAWYAEQRRAGRIPMKRAAYDSLFASCMSVGRHEAAAKYLRKGNSELSVMVNSSLGVPVKCRIDWMPSDSDAIVDLKFSASANPRFFQKHAVDMGYHLQAALYLQAWNAVGDTRSRFVFIVVEREPPYAVTVFNCTQGFLDAGLRDYERCLEVYANCVKSGVWPEYSQNEVELEPPKWL